MTKILYNGIKLECNLEDHIQRQIYFFGAYEPIELSLFLSLIPTGGTVVDAGANIGFYSLMISKKIGVAGEIHAFEPIEKNFAFLQKNLLANNIKNTKINLHALWKKEEILEFTIDDTLDKNCGTYHAVNKRVTTEKISVSAITLDQYFTKNSLKSLDAIKMDIEGSELFALDGALNTIKKYTPIIFLEVSKSTCANFDYHPNKILELLQPLSYKIYEIGNTFETSRWISDFSDISQKNVLLVTNEKVQILNQKWDHKKILRMYLN